MKGAIIGDIAGSIYEFDETAESLDFPLFVKNSRFTDDTVTTVAVAAALMEGKASCCGYIEPLRRQLRYWCRKYPDAGFGGLFRRWFLADEAPAYGSYGNGAAMRVSPAGWIADTLEEAQALAELTAVVSHDHPQAIKGAIAVASAIFLARQGKEKEAIAAYLRSHFYDLSRTLAQIRPSYGPARRTIVCQKPSNVSWKGRTMKIRSQGDLAQRRYGYAGSHCRQHCRSLLWRARCLVAAGPAICR